MDTRRRTVLVAGAAGAAAVAVGCGSGNGGDGRATQAPDAPAPARSGKDGAAPAGEVLTTTADVPVGGGKVFAEKKVVVTQPESGDFKAFSAICTHQGCPVTNVSGGFINCLCHNSKFRITDASVAEGPATTPLPAERITVSGDRILLDR